MIRCLTCIIVGLSLSLVSYAQVKLKVERNRSIKSNPATLPIVEPHLAVNPDNGKHMVAAAIVFDSAQTSPDRTHIVVFATNDNGKTWKQTDLPMTVGFDPWVAIKNANQVGLVALAGYGPGNRNGLVYYFSTDGGFTWLANDTVMFGGGHDHATMALDSRSERLYILSSVSRRDSLRLMNSYAWLNYTHDWKTFQQQASLFHVGKVNSNTLTINLSDNGQPILPYVEYVVNNERASSPNFKYVVAKDGNEFSTPYFITDKAGLAKGFPVTAVQPGGKYKGRIYLVKNTGTTPSRSNGLYLQYADSIGGKWSDEIRIDHNDAEEKFIRTAAIAVNKNGVIGIAWVDRRNDSALKKNDIYFTVSTDGGKTFIKEVKVTDMSSDPATAQNGKAGERFISGGDYMGCAAKPDGSFQLVWADNRSGMFQLYTSNIKLSK